MPDVRIIVCEACGGDKGWHVPYDIDRRDGSLIEHWRHCPYCNEHGEEEIEVEPIEMEDLEELYREQNQFTFSALT